MMFKHLIVIEPLGFLYGSMGKFLSPENLVGRSGSHFPPSAATLSGVFAIAYSDHNKLPELKDNLQLAGPFWATNQDPQNFYVPTPFNCLVKPSHRSDPASESNGSQRPFPQTGKIVQRLQWSADDQQWLSQKADPTQASEGKFESDTWIALKDWGQIAEHSFALDEPLTVDPPWEFAPHLHPRLEETQRRVRIPGDGDPGSLFLENAVQMRPGACLVYLSTLPLEDGWYRFGGEGHLVDVQCHALEDPAATLLSQSLGHSFALITPAVWGSNRLSYRHPTAWGTEIPTLTERPVPFRYRLGGKKGAPKRLARGRYAVPAGTVYVTDTPQAAWYQ